MTPPHPPHLSSILDFSSKSRTKLNRLMNRFWDTNEWSGDREISWNQSQLLLLHYSSLSLYLCLFLSLCLSLALFFSPFQLRFLCAPQRAFNTKKKLKSAVFSHQAVTATKFPMSTRKKIKGCAFSAVIAEEKGYLVAVISVKSQAKQVAPRTFSSPPHPSPHPHHLLL